jgi:DNA-binding NarL/FixJ family response regulator
LAALLALPAMWSGHEPSYVAEGLLGVLSSLLRLDCVFVQFDDPDGGLPTGGWRPMGNQRPAEIDRALAMGLSRDRTAATISLPVASGVNSIRMTMVYPTVPGEHGIVLAGSNRPDFPNELELFLLRVAVGQAAISIHTARHLAQERAARAAAEAALRHRIDLLAALFDDLTGSIGVLSDLSERVQELRNGSLPASVGSDVDRAADEGTSQSIQKVNSRASHDASPTLRHAPSVSGRQRRLTATEAILTRREAEVLGLLAEGLSNKEIAAELWLSDRTVERHITGLYRKIGAQRRTEATAFAVRHGLVHKG